jgi:uncharacterized membrane protein YphA (DoxX/SURF4 family)
MGTSLPERLEAGLILVGRILLGLVFLSASLSKIVDPASFSRAIANYRLLPPELVNFFAVVVPWVELLCGALLLLGQWVRTCSLLVSCLLVLFVVAVGASIVRGLDIQCGCFGGGSGRQVGLRLLAEDALYLVLSIFLTIRGRESERR